MNYKDFNDFELLDHIYQMDEDANEIMLYKYRPLIVNVAQKLIKTSDGSIDLNDLVQEGMLGLNEAIINFNDEKEARFGTYAKLCIERRIKKFIRNNNSGKNRLLNESVSYDIETDISDYNKYLADTKMEPLNLVSKEEWDKVLFKKINENLSDKEKEVFSLKLKGFDYKEIASILNKTPKSIDNTLQRIKMKVKNILEEI